MDFEVENIHKKSSFNIFQKTSFHANVVSEVFEDNECVIKDVLEAYEEASSKADKE